MAKANTITMRVDEKLKEQAEILCEEMGLTLSTVYTMLLKAIVHTRSIPFKMRLYNELCKSEKNRRTILWNSQDRKEYRLAVSY